MVQNYPCEVLVAAFAPPRPRSEVWTYVCFHSRFLSRDEGCASHGTAPGSGPTSSYRTERPSNCLGSARGGFGAALVFVRSGQTSAFVTSSKNRDLQRSLRPHAPTPQASPSLSSMPSGMARGSCLGSEPPSSSKRRRRQRLM